MEHAPDLLDYREMEPKGDDGPADRSAAAAAASPFNKIAALAYARWEVLRSGTNLPSIGHDPAEESRLFPPNCVQVAWDKEVSIPTISYLGKDLAEQLASLSGEAWPNLPIDSPAVMMLRDISRRAVEEGDASEFDEQAIDSQGWIRDYQGLALPFAGDEPGTYLLDVIFDLDDPPPSATARPQSSAGPDADDVLLLEQELDPDEMPHPATVPPPPPVLFVCVGDDGPATLRSRPRALKVGREPAMPALPADRWEGDGTEPDAIFARRILAVQSTPEPLLLTEPLEVPPEGKGAEVQEVPAAISDQFLFSLEAARSQAAAASGSEERSHAALYKAIGAAYDFALLAANEPDRLEQIVLDAGLTMQARAPMTPLVKLIFGADYDRSRLAEYASALSHALRIGLGPGTLADYLVTFEGGLKGVIKAERELRRQCEPTGKSNVAKLESKLRKAPLRSFENFEPEGREFSLVITRRMPDGTVAMLGEVPADERLLCSAARKFLKR